MEVTIDCLCANNSSLKGRLRKLRGAVEHECFCIFTLRAGFSTVFLTHTPCPVFTLLTKRKMVWWDLLPFPRTIGQVSIETGNEIRFLELRTEG